MSSKILIKGAGDIATGIAHRLKTCGYDLLLTDIAVPTTVRRTVAFSRAIYEGQAEVQGLTAVAVHNIEEVYDAQDRNLIPVITDPDCRILTDYQPDIVIDAILAKHNIGTSINDADFVVGVGPGFTAGIDCHCVIETQRGHYLAKTIYEGSAIPNTGIPGEIGGYSTERIIRSIAEGEFVPIRHIGDTIEKGEVVASSGGVEIRSLMPGIIRGMLQEGVHVTPGMKCGDIDARCELDHCFTISDKARAVGGGVLEAVVRYEHRRSDIGIVLLAAGLGKRYGSNKLLAEIDGVKLFTHGVEAVSSLPYDKTIVTGYPEVAQYAEARGFRAVINEHPELGISESIRLGLASVRSHDAAVFGVSDQPGVTCDTFTRLIRAFTTGNHDLAAMGQSDTALGNPCIFGRKYFPELMKLTGDRGGKTIIKQHMDDLTVVSATAHELEDIDTPIS